MIILVIIGIILLITGAPINPDEIRFSWPIGKDIEGGGNNEELYVHPDRARGFFIGGLIIRFGIVFDSIILILLTRAGKYTKTLSSHSKASIFSRSPCTPVLGINILWWLVLILFLSSTSIIKSCIVNLALYYLATSLEIDTFWPWFFCAPFLYVFLSVIQLGTLNLAIKSIVNKTTIDKPQDRKIIPLLISKLGDTKIIPLLILALGDFLWNFLGSIVEAFHLYFSI